MKKFENPMMEIAFFEAENVCTTASGVKPIEQKTAEQVATEALNAKGVTDIKTVQWIF